MKKLLPIVGLTAALSGQAQATELWDKLDLSGINPSFTVSSVQSHSEEFAPGREYKFTLHKDNFNVWASYGHHDHNLVSQSLGDVAVGGFGIGFTQEIFPRISIYGDIGIGIPMTDYRERVEQEVAYYIFVREGFGHPPFVENKGNIWGVEYKNELDDYGFLGRIGIEYQATKNLYLGFGYSQFQVEQYLSVFNNDVGGGFDREDPDKCGCLWEGQWKANMSGLRLSIKWKL